VCVQGLGGHGCYYQALAARLLPEGIGVIASDLRGHGRSMGRRGDIDRFTRYLEDVDATVRWARIRWPPTPIVLLGESMGASIALIFAAEMQQCPETSPLVGLALVAPVFQPALRPTPREVARFVCALFTAPSRPLLPITGREEVGCRDDAFNASLRADPLFVRHVSVRFLIELTRWLRHATRIAAQVLIPVLVLRGEQDHVAHPGGTNRFLKRLASAAQTVVTIPEAYHSLFFDLATPAVLSALIAWLDELPEASDDSTSQS
jgi:alpha-beta hydrolase superfamily lysophospholipase